MFTRKHTRTPEASDLHDVLDVPMFSELPDGSAAHFDSSDPIVPDANGEYVGRITNSGTWLTGEYTVQVQTKSTTVAAMARAPSSTARSPSGAAA